MNEIEKELLKLTEKAIEADEAPIAAIIVNKKGKIISKAYNKRNETKKTTDHAEIIAIEIANKKLKKWRLNNCSLYVTVKPCPMCMSVIKEARIKEIYYWLERDAVKKQYSKTQLIKIKSDSSVIFESKIKKFWLNIRKK